uniref:ORF6 n=1 Tax=Cydia pomonella granulosis virus TaxID=28289 RepID=A0A5B8HAS5_GVCP|nr:ORF6 [Cydia pomonella granulovirus]
MFTKPNTIVHLPQNRRHDYNFVKFYTSLMYYKFYTSLMYYKFYTSLMYYKFYTSLMCHIQQGGETSPTLWARIRKF